MFFRIRYTQPEPLALRKRLVRFRNGEVRSPVGVGWGRTAVLDPECITIGACALQYMTSPDHSFLVSWYTFEIDCEYSEKISTNILGHIL